MAVSYVMGITVVLRGTVSRTFAQYHPFRLVRRQCHAILV